MAAQRGLSDSLIQTLGQWKSAAFMEYIRTDIATLTSTAAKLARVVVDSLLYACDVLVPCTDLSYTIIYAEGRRWDKVYRYCGFSRRRVLLSSQQKTVHRYSVWFVRLD